MPAWDNLVTPRDWKSRFRKDIPVQIRAPAFYWRENAYRKVGQPNRNSARLTLWPAKGYKAFMLILP